MTRSRLGKGLGALFPTLPGETAKPETTSAPSAQGAGQATGDGSAKGSAFVKPTVTAQASVDAVHGMSKKSVSRETKRNGGKKNSRRASVPSITLNEVSHPADMFFGSTVPAGAAPSAGHEHDAASSASAASGRNTSGNASKKADDTKKQEEQELLPVQGGYLVELHVRDVGPNLHQPRTIFDEDDLRELAESIKEVGVLQPIVVRKRPMAQIEAARKEMAARAASKDGSDASTQRGVDAAQHGAQNAEQGSAAASDASTGSESRNMFDGRMDSMYELIMGERRWRASQIAGLDTIPAIVKTTADDDMLRDALLENLHRVALNPLEEAAAYQQMIDDFGLTQAQLSKSVSKSRPQIANTLRLLNLPSTVQKKVASGMLTAGHARALLGLPTEADMERLATRIISEGLSVRSTEEIVSMKAAESDQPKKPKANKLNPWAGTPVQMDLEKRFDTKVSIKGSKKHGRIEIVFKSEDDMKRIVDLLMRQQ